MKTRKQLDASDGPFRIIAIAFDRRNNKAYPCDIEIDADKLADVMMRRGLENKKGITKLAQGTIVMRIQK